MIILKTLLSIVAILAGCIAFALFAYCFLLPLFLILSCLTNGIEDSIKVKNVRRTFKIKSDENARMFTLLQGAVYGIITSILVFLIDGNLLIVAIQLAAAITLLAFAIMYKVRRVEA